MADEAHYSSPNDSTPLKRKYEDQSSDRPTGFSAGPATGIELAKQRAQEVATRLLSVAPPPPLDAKRAKPDNGAPTSGFDSYDAKPQYSAVPPVSYSHQGTSKKIDIPNGRVGVIIGKGGETIKYLQLQSGAKIQVTRDMDADPNSTSRTVELMGTPEAIASAEKLINEVLAEAESGGSGIVARRLTGQAGSDEFVMRIPNNKVGLIIGKGGETIKNMQASTGARIQVIPLHLPPGDTSTERTLKVDGTPEQIESAKELVNQIISGENRLRNPSMSGGYPQQGYQSRPPSNWAPPAPMQQPGYGYVQPGAYSGPSPQYNMPQQQYSGYPPQQPGGYSTNWDQSSAPSHQQSTHAGGYDYYSQQPQQPQNPGGPAPPADGSAYNYSQPPSSGYSQPGQGYAQDSYNAYNAQSQSGYGQPPTYDQQQGYGSVTGYGSGSNPAQEGHTASYASQGDSAQAPSTQQPQQGYPTSQQPSSNTAIKTVFFHPCILMSLSFSLGSYQNIANGNVEDDFNMLNVVSNEGFHKFGNPIVKILSMTLDHMWSLFSSHLWASTAEDVASLFVKDFKGLQQKLFLDVRDRFELCVRTEDVMPLLPTLCTLHTLHKFLSPFELLELVDWMFSRVEVDDLPIKKSLLSVGCSLAADAFSALSIYFQQSSENRAPYDLFWEMDVKNMKADIFEQIYSRVVECSVCFEVDSADRCLLEAVNALYTQKHMQEETFHPLLLIMWKIIMVTPLKILSHCIYKTNVKKARFLHILTELSSLHSLIFGHSFLGIVNRSLHNDIGVMEHISDLTLSEDQFILLLPASLSYLSLISKRFGEQSPKDCEPIPYFYSKVLLKGFSQWRSFSSKDIFEEQYGELFPSSVQELLCLIDHSLLGKSIHMLQYHFALNGDSIKLKKRLNLFKSICPKLASHDDLMDCESQVIDSYSPCQSLNIINHVVSKISLCRILLFHEKEDGGLKDVSVKMQSKMGRSRIRFINTLVDIWQFIVKKFSLASDQSRTAKGTDISLLYNHMEGFLLKSILELVGKMQNDLIQLQSISFLEQLVRSALLYRFGDFTTMKTLRVILSQLNEGRLSFDLYLQLLLAHSQFAPTLRSVHKPAGSFLKPVSSILKCLVIPSIDYRESDVKQTGLTTVLSSGPLEIVKMLWILLWMKARQTDSDYGNDIKINLKELHALLRHSYGATVSWINLAIYNLMQQIESMSCLLSQNVKLDSETIEEWYRSHQRDNFPIDPDICVSTVLYFPFDRSISDELPSANKIEPDTVRKKVHYSHVEDRERYDPAFILRFSIYSLSKAYVEPVEFAGSGLLAVAFVSMSSLDNGIRRLAYATLDKFKNALEKCQKRKDVMGLRLLLNSVQNSIEEPWQRIPSVISLFAAEASCVLLDPTNDHYAAISTFLIHSSKLNMRVIPMFDNFFWSTSVNFKAERSWILRLVCAGLNSDDDAMIYIRNSILETLMSFYVSPLSDFESKNLIIEVIRKSVKSHKITCHLVKHCSFFSWFSSLISVSRQRFNGEENKVFLKHVLVALKVVNDVISFGRISKWLKNHSLEQLMELSSNLFNFLFHDGTLANETLFLVNPFLQMVASTLKLSQSRKIYQPHFTLSIEGLYQMYQTGSVYNKGKESIKPELALEAILMNASPVSIFSMNQERLQSFLIWATTTALKSESIRRLGFNEYQFFRNDYREEFRENSVVSTLLRWLTASVIIGKLRKKSDYRDSGVAETHNFESLNSLLVYVENTSGQRNDIGIGAEELLASTILYLQLRLGVNHEVLPSVVCALCLLIFGASNFAVGKTDLLQDYDTLVSSHSSRVRCPPEVNPSWRWSFYQPWKDDSLELTDSQQMEAYHACLSLLVIISNVLGGKKLESASLSPVDLEKSGLFQWERSLLRD